MRLGSPQNLISGHQIYKIFLEGHAHRPRALGFCFAQCYPVDCACICPLQKIQHHCLCPNGRCNPPLASHPPPPPPTPLPPPPPHLLIYAIPDITVTVKKVAQNPAVLAS